MGENNTVLAFSVGYLTTCGFTLAVTGRTQLQTFKVESFQTPTTEKIVPARSVKVTQNQLVSSVKLFSALSKNVFLFLRNQGQTEWGWFSLLYLWDVYDMLPWLFRLIDDAWQGSDLICFLSEKWSWDTMAVFTHCSRILLSGFFWGDK